MTDTDPIGQNEIIDLDDLALAFRYGADMAPDAIQAATPGARFIARAHLADRGATIPPDELLWGVLLFVPAGHPALDGRDRQPVRTDDGRVAQAVLLTEPEDLADHAAVLAQARYWELHPDYVRALAGRATED